VREFEEKAKEVAGTERKKFRKPPPVLPISKRVLLLKYEGVKEQSLKEGETKGN
jgi:hypothetical protein